MSDEIDCIGIIPARYGSTRFPGKPLAIIMGKTLLQRTYENALRCERLKLVVVATDDVRIYDHVKSFGGTVVMTSKDCDTGTDRLAEVIMRYPHLRSAIVVNIQGDEPCIDPKTIEAVVDILHGNPQASMSTAAVLLDVEEDAINPSIVKCTMDQQGNALYFSRTLIPSNKNGKYCCKTRYYRHLGIYGYRPNFLLEYALLPKTPLQSIEDLEQLKALEHGYRIKVAIVNNGAVGVDLPEDIQKIEALLCTQNTSLLQAESVHP